MGAKSSKVKSKDEIKNKIMKSICKITIGIKEEITYGTGFFLNYSDSLKCLLKIII